MPTCSANEKYMPEVYRSQVCQGISIKLLIISLGAILKSPCTKISLRNQIWLSITFIFHKLGIACIFPTCRARDCQHLGINNLVLVRKFRLRTCGWPYHSTDRPQSLHSPVCNNLCKKSIAYVKSI